MKWTREAPGHYVSGKWSIEGEGTSWTLYEGSKKRHKAKSKKDCQQIAENAEEGVDGHSEPNEEVPPPQPKGKTSKLDLDGVLASLRLEIDQLSWRISSLDDANRKLAESNAQLTNAVMILGKHIAKMKGK